MAKTITISLPVADLPASTAFYAALGFTLDAQMTVEDAAFLIWSESITVALLTYTKWREFTDRPIPPTSMSEVALNISCESRAAVDAMCAAAGRHGGTIDVNPVQDHGSMYGRDFTDLDGHVWGAVWIETL